ncbi:MAG: hypothetical protein KDB79_14680 [Acidobacteria bacterium]|nr:hypothetical protein [Acidobacteriota bacterium]
MNNSKRYLGPVIAILLCCAGIFAQGENFDKSVREELVGVWQNAPSVGSGMSDNFQFFADGTYKFNYNEMDAAKRLLSHSGKWDVKEGKLILKIETVELLIGGKLIEAGGSAASLMEVEGGQVITKRISPTEIVSLSLESFVKEDLHNTTKIDDVKYWKMSSDPKTFEN